MGSIEPMVSVAGRRVPLAEFIADCLDPAGDEELVAARLTFLAGGLDALRTAGAPRWTQVGLAGIAAGLYPALRDDVEQLLADGEITDFLFTHGSPGMRVRFAAAPGRATQVRAEVRRLAARWRRRGLVAEAVPGVYEPEAHLFGGPDSMRHAYQLFTVDSLFWLRLHSADGFGSLSDSAPAWVVSLRMLRAVFDGLQITGWEDRDVWARVREITGGEAGMPTEELVGWWTGDEDLLSRLPEPTRELLARHEERVTPVLDRWRAEYFATDQARVGPREAAAYHVVQHWNRAKLGPARQARILDALVGRRAG
ncbi:thiopeptide-type bacteriocin biosynthesis protein [Kutzneria chonburiensis]|uniref:Thiopeptide-type bacteriocin biosynthesis protein n=1 Tax=Kutzneria chonburiensis TaxID=1483604 RepID=A0ABV6MYE0_9PSEU|nr:thiopeptide-type bacteriocin biosynthesis protein [Kutzneria chonburiensis]